MNSIFAKREDDWRFGKKDKQSLNFVFFDEGNKVNCVRVHHTELADCIANDDDYLSDMNDQIEKLCVYREGKVTSRQFHAFVLMKTKNYYYTIERWADCVSLQRSRTMNDVVFFDKTRKRSPIRETEWASGKGSICDVVQLLLDKKLFETKYHMYFRNCQMFVALVFKHCNADGKKFKKYRKRYLDGTSAMSTMERFANAVEDVFQDPCSHSGLNFLI